MSFAPALGAERLEEVLPQFRAVWLEDMQVLVFDAAGNLGFAVAVEINRCHVVDACPEDVCPEFRARSIDGCDRPLNASGDEFVRAVASEVAG